MIRELELPKNDLLDTWELSEKSYVLKELDSKRENIGDQLLSEIFDKTFSHSDKNFRAIYVY